MPECRVLIRVQIPDRPGALGLVASRVGAVKGDIVGIEILDRAGGSAVDELAVVLPDADLLSAVVREIHEVDGSSVLDVEAVDDFPVPRVDELRWAWSLSRVRELPELAGMLSAAIDAFARPRWIHVTGPGFTQLAGGAVVGGGLEPLVAPDDPTETFTLEQCGVTLSFTRESPLRPGEQAVVRAYCDLADSWSRLLPGDPPPIDRA